MPTYNDFIERYHAAMAQNAWEAAETELANVIAAEPDGVFDDDTATVYIVLPGTNRLTILHPVLSSTKIDDVEPSHSEPGIVYNVSSADRGAGHSHG